MKLKSNAKGLSLGISGLLVHKLPLSLCGPGALRQSLGARDDPIDEVRDNCPRLRGRVVEGEVEKVNPDTARHDPPKFRVNLLKFSRTSSFLYLTFDHFC